MVQYLSKKKDSGEAGLENDGDGKQNKDSQMIQNFHGQ